MATINNAKLTVKRDTRKKLVRVKVTAKIKFTPLEICMMKNCRKAKMFKVKAQLWGEDGFLTGADDFIYTYPTVKFLPDSTPSSTETITFTETVGEGLLDEDFGRDEVYGKVILYNYLASNSTSKKTNVVKDWY